MSFFTKPTLDGYHEWECRLVQMPDGTFAVQRCVDSGPDDHELE